MTGARRALTERLAPHVRPRLDVTLSSWWHRKHPTTEHREQMAQTAEHLAVLLAAGADPHSALAWIVDSGRGTVVDDLRTAVERHRSFPDVVHAWAGMTRSRDLTLLAADLRADVGIGELTSTVERHALVLRRSAERARERPLLWRAAVTWLAGAAMTWATIAAVIA